MWRIFLLCLTWQFSGLLVAQGSMLNIKVQDAKSQSPLAYATLYLKGSAVGTTTQENGQAQLPLSPNLTKDTLVCSYVGYQTQLLAINAKQLAADFTILLEPQAVVLGEVQVTDRKALKPKQILKQVFKNTASNYGKKFSKIEANYRESLEQDGHYIQYNEAAVEFNYSGYPQRFDKQIWKSWYEDKEYAFTYERTFFPPILHYFNTKADQVRIIESRSSDHLDKYHEEHSINGGPLDFIALDLVKYQCDFLNPRLINKYQFEKKGVEFINGHNCYVLQFQPRPSKRSFRVDMGKKIKQSLHTGRVYIDINSFAVVRAAYQLVPEVDFGFFAKRKPLEYKVALDYIKQSGRWRLNSIDYSELRAIATIHHQYSPLRGPSSVDPASDEVTLYRANRRLQILHNEVKPPVPFLPAEQLKHTRYTALRYFEKPYAADFWEKYSRENGLTIPPAIERDLAQQNPLTQQFEERFKQKQNLPIPFAQKQQHLFNYPLETLTDNYHWFADSTTVDSFFNYLKAENEYSKNYLIPGRKQQQQLFDQVNDFYVQDTSRALPYAAGDLRFARDSLDQQLLYEYVDSSQRKFIFNLSAFQQQRPNSILLKIKKSSDYLALLYTADASRSTHLLLFSKGSATVLDSISSVFTFEFFKNDEFIYTLNNDQYTSFQVHHKKIGSAANLIYQEADPTFDIDLYSDEQYIYCHTLSKSESEIYLINKKNTSPKLQLLIAREEGINYTAKVTKDYIYLLTNQAAPNHKIMRQSIAAFPLGDWSEIVPTQKQLFVTDFWVTADYLILKAYGNSFPILKYKNKQAGTWKNIPLPHDIFDAELKVINNDSLLISYSAPNQLFSQYVFNIPQHKLSLRKQLKSKVPETLAPLSVKRVWAPSTDGLKIPITIVSSSNPLKAHKGLMLKVYGAYGAITAAGFDPVDAVLAQEGFTIAYAHVRGGSLLGGDWYQQGKLLTKENTFSDYLACADYLIAKNYTDAEHLIGYGISAGGLPLAVAINRRPELFAAAIFDHAFVDVLTTMMNPNYPLTQDEYKEWGNPQDAAYYQYIKNYCPYQNVKPQDYPPLLFLAGALDFQTPAWQISKYAAKVKEMKTNANPVLLLTDFAGGHRGDGSGESWIRDAARMYGFMISAIGLR